MTTKMKNKEEEDLPKRRGEVEGFVVFNKLKINVFLIS